MPIALQDVVRATQSTPLEPAEAFRGLQARKLLAAEARRRGVRVDPNLALSQRKALVQALLHDAIEATTSVSEDALQAAYAERASRFRPSERRGSVHILVKKPRHMSTAQREAAERLAGVARTWLGQLPFEEATKRAQQLGKELGFEVKAERLPATGRGGRLEANYIEALFEVSAGNVVPRIVETRFGFHAVKVTDVVPAEILEFEEVRPQLLTDLQVKKRRAALAELLQALEHKVRVVRNTDGMAAITGISL